MTPKRRLLVVDDEFYFRSTLKQTLTEAGYDVFEAEDGSIAQQMVGLQDYDAVISDVRMIKVSGIELLKWIKANKPVPVILMTGFEDALETAEAARLGADGFVPKPFKMKELLQVLEPLLTPKASPEAVDLDDQYRKISVIDFVSGGEIKFDIYIRISTTRYIKVAHTGENMSPERIKSYQSKNLKYFYLTTEDFKSYLGLTISLSKKVAASSVIEISKKMNFLRHTSEVIVENFFGCDLDAEIVQHARVVVETTASLLSDHPDALDLLHQLSKNSDQVYSHSVAVSMYGAMIGKQMGWESPLTLFRVSMGGLMHDIGKKEIPNEILQKSKGELTAEEIKLIETHTRRGVALVADLKGIPSDVMDIVQQHHENCLGTGYPAHLKKEKIHPLARVVSVANEFCNLTLKQIATNSLSPTEAIERLLYQAGFYDPDVMCALGALFKVAIPSSDKKKAA